MITWSIKSIKIKDLKKHTKNPRKISREKFEQLQGSIKRFGLIDKPIVNLDYTIIAGHQRLEALKKSGLLEVDCWVPDQQLTEKDVDDLNLIHNRIHGDFDYDILADNYDVPDLLDCGFTAVEMQIIEELEDVEEPKANKKKKECPNCGHEF